jgi:hypothetical protein
MGDEISESDYTILDWIIRSFFLTPEAQWLTMTSLWEASYDRQL